MPWRAYVSDASDVDEEMKRETPHCGKYVVSSPHVAMLSCCHNVATRKFFRSDIEFIQP